MTMKSLLDINENTTADDLREAMAAGLDPNARDVWSGAMPLHNAHNAEQTQALLDGGADPNACNGENYGDRMPLHHARNAEVTRALLAAGADPNAQDEYGATPLHNANSTEQTKALLDAGADPNARDDNGYTPLHKMCNTEQTRLLIAAGADVNARSDDIPDQEPSNTEWRYWREENAPQVVGRDAAGEDVYEYPNLPEPRTIPGHAGKVPLEMARCPEQAKALLDASAKVPENLSEEQRGYVEQAQASQATKGESFVLSDRARETVRPEPAKSAADYKTLNAVWGRDMSPDAMNERACAWADQDKPYQDAMEPAALDRRAKAQDEWEREHTHSNPFGGKAIKAETDEKSPMDELRDLRQEHEDGLKVLREDADFLNAAVKGHREYSLVYATLADRGGVLDATKLAERTEASRAHDPAVQDMLAKTEPVRERSDEGGRSDDGGGSSGGSGGVVRSDDSGESGTGGGGMAKPALKKSLAAATGR